MQRVSIILLWITSVWAHPFSKFVPIKDLGPRIINGQPASLGQFPWQVAIYVTVPGATNLCGGALISDTWVLTAGHCVQDATNFRLALGSNQLSGDDSNRVVQSTEQFVQHEDYNQFTLDNDVAVIPLPSPVSFNDNIQPIALAESALDADTVVTVSGWGLTSGDGASNDLNYVDLVTISTNDCSAAYGSSIGDGVICAQGDGAEVHSTCEGDSGGPLVIDAGSNPVHVGIVSFGHSDGCESGKPAGFARTYFYRDWIRDTTGV
ncbi:chymotrypsin BI-like isoform X2 [Zophobas morio]|uniref:chymotrypsin BI-like isoform X2 n=1 Tax=Zophobas morio TaxID=2755281 RepID=UPI003083E4DD